MSAVLRLWHLCSLDAPTVAVVWAMGFARAAEVTLPLWVPALLGLVTWAVYIGDRLLDAKAGLGSGQTRQLRERHHFHWRHRRRFLIAGTMAACGAGWIVLGWMPVAVRERDTLLAAAAMAYFTGVHTGRGGRRLPKELLVGILFTAGCILPALSRAGSHGWWLCGPALFFAALAWLNCHAIESWESGRERPGSTAIARRALLLGALGLPLAPLVAGSQPRAAWLLMAGVTSAVLLACLDRIRLRISPVAVRAAADLVLLTPVLLLLR